MTYSQPAGSQTPAPEEVVKLRDMLGEIGSDIERLHKVSIVLSEVAEGLLGVHAVESGADAPEPPPNSILAGLQRVHVLLARIIGHCEYTVNQIKLRL